MTLGPGRSKVDRDWFGLEQFRPGPRFIRDGAVLYLLDEVGSTNTFLRGQGEPARGRLCRWDGWGWRAGERSLLSPPARPVLGSVAVARRQTAGRGRQGRQWRDCGGLNLSVVVPPHVAVAGQGFSVWLGLQTVLALRAGHHFDARLKWPNDIVVGRRKLGGILLERSTDGADESVVGGLGLNLATPPGGFPAELQTSATSILIESGHAPGPGELAGRLLRRIESEFDRFRAEGWAPFRPALALVDSLLGRRVRLEAGRRLVEGRAEGIDDGGRLLVRTGGPGGGLETFFAGDVHVLSDHEEGDGP
jgi:biotin-[acetyl-CoA-carboxylase] ligase BirA-like protein